MEIPTISFMLFSLLFGQLFCFWRDYHGNAAKLVFCVILAIVLYIEYIKIRVQNFHLIIYANYKTYAKARLCKFLSQLFATVKDNYLPNYLER